ncbi:MAG: hypothetical protein VB144_01055 [Clostridia bacterium]|nr:hypothetical protein [Clostridia bacterium]
MPSEEDILGAIRGRVPKHGCPSCGGRQWEVQPLVFVSNVYSEDTRGADPENGAPTVVAVCKSCGLFLHYGAVRLGLVDPD